MRLRESKSAPVGVVTKVLRILDALHASPAGLQLKDVAKETGLNKSAAYRFLAHLEHEAYIFRDVSGAYAIGVKLARLGSGVSYQATLCKIARPIILQQLWEATGETENLAVIDGHEVLYLDVIESSRHTFRLVSQIGIRRPLYCTSLDKVMLAFTPDQQQDHLLSGLTFGPTPRTTRSPAQLRKEFALILQRGYAIDDEEAYLGSRCIGAAIFDGSQQVAAAVSVSGPVTRVTREKILIFARAVKNAAAAISKGLGYCAWIKS